MTVAAYSGTVIGRFLQRAVERGSQTLWFHQVHGRWQPVSWEAALHEVLAVAAGLASLGVAAGDRVGLVGPNSPRWVIADYAIQHLGGVVVPMYPYGPAEELGETLRKTRVRVCIAGDDELVRALGECRAPLDHVIAWHLEEEDDGVLLGWEAVVSRGASWLEQYPQALSDALGRVRPEDPATVIFTSGTGGDPKGAVLSHQNLVWTAEAAVAAVGTRARETTLSYLPLAHAFERIITTVIPLVAPGQRWTCWFVDDLARLPAALRTVRPTIFVAVPLVWSRIHARVLDELKAIGPVRRKTAELALTVSQLALQGNGGGWRRTLGAGLIGRRILKRIGLGRCWYAVSGAAPLQASTQRFIQGLGLPLHQGWGLTETTALCTVQAPDEMEIDRVGKPLPGVAIKIGDGDEILVRGPNVFVGYEGDISLYGKQFDQDGFFRTGDIGAIGDDGQLQIVDRLKDVVITSGGRKVAPRRIEERLEGDPLVSAAMVLGEARPYLIALIVLDGPAAARLVEGPLDDEGGLWEHPTVVQRVGEVVERVNATLPVPEQLHRFAVLPFGFPDEALTPTLKVKRRVVENAFASTIDDLYR